MIRNEIDMYGQNLYMFAVQAVKQTSKQAHSRWMVLIFNSYYFSQSSNHEFSRVFSYRTNEQA